MTVYRIRSIMCCSILLYAAQKSLFLRRLSATIVSLEWAKWFKLISKKLP